MKDKNKPTQKQLSAGIDFIISSIYFNESARQFKSVVRTKEKLDRFNGRVQRFTPHEVLNEQAQKVIDESNKLSEYVTQLLVKKRGSDPIIEMSYNLIDMFQKISYLSTDDQEKVKEFLNSLKDEKENK